MSIVVLYILFKIMLSFPIYDVPSEFGHLQQPMEQCLLVLRGISNHNNDRDRFNNITLVYLYLFTG